MFFIFFNLIIPKNSESSTKRNIPPSRGKLGGGGAAGGGGSGAAKTAVPCIKNTTRIIKILFGTIFIVRKSIKKIYSPK